MAVPANTEPSLLDRFPVFVLALILCGMPSAVRAEASTTPGLPQITLTIADHTLHAEVAHTPQARAKGLMFRSSLAADAGMLFVFPHSDYYGMWMKNTMIALSVAFITANGLILNIADMQPYSLTVHYSDGRAKYALEMNRGWFASREIRAGARIDGLENAPAAYVE